jgi:hypothetical protein
MTNSINLDPTLRRIGHRADDPPEGPAPPDDDDGRAGRRAANERYDTYVGAGPSPELGAGSTPELGPRCKDAFGEHHDYDGCGTDDLEGPALYLKQAGAPDDVSPSDVHQGPIGDCFLMATLASLAGTPEGRMLIKNAITERTDERGAPVYVVTLHEPHSHWFAPTTFTDVAITVDSHFAKGHAKPPDPVSPQESWPLVMEKAYALFRGGYNAIARGGRSADVMEVLTGKPAERIDLGWFSHYSAERLETDLAAGRPITFETKPGIDDHTPPHLVDNHVYSVAGTEVRDGRLYVRLLNPWNHSQPDPIPCDEMNDWFRRVTVGPVMR